MASRRRNKLSADTEDEASRSATGTRPDKQESKQAGGRVRRLSQIVTHTHYNKERNAITIMRGK